MTPDVEIKHMLQEAWRLRTEGKYDESKTLLGKAQNLCQPDDFNLLGRIYHIYMQHEYDRQNLEEALAFSNESVAQYTQAKNLDRLAHAIRHRGDIQSELGRLDSSERDYLSALGVYKKDLNVYNGDLANALRSYALLLEKRKLYGRALRIWKEVKDIYVAYQISPGIAEATDKINQLKEGDEER
ncbi:MAG: hypothetical protein AAF694_26390 [Bacteroidota bacterium]